MALALPPFVVLKSNSNGKYLCPVVGDSQAETYGCLQFTGEDVFGPSAKYEVEAADDGLVHIRSCCNNKYWATRSEFDYRIVTQATEQEEDRDKWSCTLFKPTINGDARTVRFHHVQLNRSVSVMPSSEIEASPTEPGVECAFIDWESLLMLPKHVAFKGNNSCYLIARHIKHNICQCIPWKVGDNYMQFTGKDNADQTVRNDIFVNADGYVRIKSHCNSYFWRRDPTANWILADSNTNDPVPDELFWPVKISDKVIALRSKGNNLYCERNTKNSRLDCLRASVDDVSNEAHLEVEETVLSRTIQNVKFRLADARVQRKKVDVYVSDDIINNSPKESVEELMFSYSKTRSSTWSSSVSLKLGVKTTIKAGIPSITQGQLDISGEISKSIQWGEEEKASNEIARKHTVTVPARTAMNVIVTATMGTFEVPFSYTQSDTLTSREQVFYRKNDGVYIGENYFEFQQRNTLRNAI